MPRMTQALKMEAIRAYFDEGMEAEEIANMLGVTTRQVLTALDDPKLLEPYRKRAEAAKLRAQICVNESAENAAKKQASLLHDAAAEKAQSVSQRAAKDILDRAGVRVQKDERREITITFAGPTVKLGMPGNRTDEER